MRRGLLVTVLALACAWSSPGLSGAETCATREAYQQVVETPGAGGTDLLPVPLVIHLMQRPGHPCEVGKWWTPTRVQAVFGPGTQSRPSAPSIWSVGKVRFFVQDVQIHEYAPPDALIDNQGGLMGMKVPAAVLGPPDFEKAFDGLVAQFDQAHSVNVYLWWRIGGGPLGFGRSNRRGPGKATVWLDTTCDRANRQKCSTVAAHELGHRLGLYDLKAENACTGVRQEFQDVCQTVTAPCPPTRLTDRLMFSGGRGTKLCREEVKEAERMATTDLN